MHCHRAARGPGVKGGRAVFGETQSDPQALLLALLALQLTHRYGHRLAGSKESIESGTIHGSRFGNKRSFRECDRFGNQGRLDRYIGRSRCQRQRNFHESRGFGRQRRTERLDQCNLFCGKGQLGMDLRLNQK